jgi:hypothetical protein
MISKSNLPDSIRSSLTLARYMRKTLSKKYPQGFTRFVAEVADTAMRAVQQADPYHICRNWVKAETLQLARLHRGMTAEDHFVPLQRHAFRLEVVPPRSCAISRCRLLRPSTVLKN